MIIIVNRKAFGDLSFIGWLLKPMMMMLLQCIQIFAVIRS